MRKYHFYLFCVVFILAFSACVKAAASKESSSVENNQQADPIRAEFALNTVCSITLFDQAKESVYNDIFNRLNEIENLMSAHLPNTDISRINAYAGKAPVKVHSDVFNLIERALYFAEISGGAFDPTVGPLVNLWGITSEKPRLPSRTEINAVLPLINWRNVELDRQNQTVFLKNASMALDLGAIAKGYAADEVISIIKEAKIDRAIVDLGGNVATFGVKADKSPWRVGLQNPEFGKNNRGAYIGIIPGPAKTVVTSGVYERYFEYNGTYYHHIFSPYSGYPASNGLMSVTIVADTSMDADALSTATFVMGYEKGRVLIDSIKGVEAIFVFEDKTIRKTSGLEFILTDSSYKILTQ